VLDVETTGLFPKTDRIVELAVLRINAAGDVLEEFETLVNPDRDLGPTDLHGISGADIARAPHFKQVADYFLGTLSNAIVVGHNVRFDLTFLSREFSRIGAFLPDLPRICTLQMANRRNLAARRLDACCRALGVGLDNPHTAAGDARATAALFSCLLKQSEIDSFEDLGCHGKAVVFERPLTVPPLCPRRVAADHVREKQRYLSSLVERLPARSGSPPAENVACYLEVLDRCLEDRKVDPSEADGLVALARDFGMSKTAVMDAHKVYFESVLALALEDQVITDDERKDLALVANLLGLGDSVMQAIPRTASGDNEGRCLRERNDLRGKTVCFTGQTKLVGETISRETAQRLATDAGLVVVSGVTKGLDILVVADPDTLSGKAKKARKYGVRIMADTVFWQKVGVS